MIAAAVAAKTGVAASQISITQINSVSFDTPKYARTQPSVYEYDRQSDVQQE